MSVVIVKSCNLKSCIPFPVIAVNRSAVFGPSRLEIVLLMVVAPGADDFNHPLASSNPPSIVVKEDMVEIGLLKL